MKSDERTRLQARAEGYLKIRIKKEILMPKNTAKKDRSEPQPLRTYLQIPAELAGRLIQRFEYEKNSELVEKRMPYGQWLAEKALAGIESDGSKKEPGSTAGPQILDPKIIEDASSLGARVGVEVSLRDFSTRLGDILAERIFSLEGQLATSLGYIEEELGGLNARVAGLRSSKDEGETR